MNPLTPKQQRFVEEYLVDLNGQEAARRAGYNGSDGTLAAIASQNLTKLNVKAAIEEKQSQLSKSTRVTTERVLLEISRLAFSDPRKLYNEDGSLKAVHELDDDTAATLASMEAIDQWEGTGADRKFVGTLKKIKQWDKNSALEKLCRHLGLFNDKLKLQGDQENPIQHVHNTVESYLQELATESVVEEEDGGTNDESSQGGNDS